MLKRGRVAGPRWLLPTAVPVLALLTLITLRHPRVIYTSDSVAQQSIVRGWLDAGHRTTYLPTDTWALKIPLYLGLENLPLAPLDRLLAAILVLNAVTFLLLGWAGWTLAAGWGAGVRWYEVAVPIGWLATLGGGIGSNRMLPNYRNIELGLSFVILAVVARYLAEPSPISAGPVAKPASAGWGRRVAVAAAGVLLPALLWFDDPYVEVLLGAPLAVAALGWYLVRERDRRLLYVAGALLASCLVNAGLQASTPLVGIRLDAAPALGLSPSALIRHLGLLPSRLNAQLGTDRWDGTTADLATRALVVLVIALLVLASTALAWYGWRQKRFVVTFVGLHWPLVVAGFVIQDSSAGRYLILGICDLAMAATLVLPELRVRGRTTAARLLVGVLAVGAVLSFGTGANSLIGADRRPSEALTHQRAVVDAVRRAALEHGAVKGYAPFWDGSIHSYLAGARTTTAEIVCSNGRLSTREWLSDSAKLTRPANGPVFVIWDPRAVYLAGCPVAERDAQLGAPLLSYPLTPTSQEAPAGGVDAVLVYPADIEARLRP